MRATPELAEAMLAALKGELDDGFIYIFSGPVPELPGDALGMVSDHTQLAMLSKDGDGSTGLTFEAPVDHSISKAAAESWRGLVAFDGAEDSETTLTPTFFRFCPAGDDGRSASDTPRLQGTVGGPNSNADFWLASDTLTANGSNETGAAGFNFSLTSNA